MESEDKGGPTPWQLTAWTENDANSLTKRKVHIAGYRYYFKPSANQKWRQRLEDAEHFLVPLKPASQQDPVHEESKYSADKWANPTLPSRLANPFVESEQNRWVIGGMSGGPLFDVHVNGQVVKSATVHGVVSYVIEPSGHVFCPILAESVEAINLFMTDPNGSQLRQRIENVMESAYPAGHEYNGVFKFGAGYYADRQGNKLQTVNPAETNVGYLFLNSIIYDM